MIPETNTDNCELVEAIKCNVLTCCPRLSPGNIFNSVTVFILAAGIGNARSQIFQRQIHQNGGQTESSLCPSVTHVVVDDSMDLDRALRLLKVNCLPSGVQLVKCTWLSSCISEKQLLDVGSYSLLLPKRFVSQHNLF